MSPLKPSRPWTLVVGAGLAVTTAAAIPLFVASNDSQTSSATAALEVPFSQRVETKWVAPPPRSALSERWDYFWHQRAYPFDSVPAGARLAAMKESRSAFRNVKRDLHRPRPQGLHLDDRAPPGGR